MVGICSLMRAPVRGRIRLWNAMDKHAERKARLTKRNLPMAKPNTQRRRRSKFSTSNVVPWMLGKRAGPPRFGDLRGSVLVRDKLTSIDPRLGRDGLIFEFKSGEEEAWWRSRFLRTSIWTSACRLSSRTTGYAGMLPEGPASALFSMQWWSLARTT